MSTEINFKAIPPSQVDRFIAKVPDTNLWMLRYSNGGGYFSADGGATAEDLLCLEKDPEKRAEINRIFDQWCSGRLSFDDEVCIAGQKIPASPSFEADSPPGP